MGVRAIPGYYFDKEKNKYFKIQPSGTAPATSAYSSHDVKRRKLREARVDAQELAVAQQQGLIKRSRLLAEPLCGGILARENGQIKLDTAQILARRFVPQGRMVTLERYSGSNQSAPVFALVHRPNIEPSTSVIYVAYNGELVSGPVRPNKPAGAEYDIRYSLFRRDDERQPERGQRNQRRPPGHSRDSTSLSTSEQRGLLAATCLSASSETGIAIVPLRPNTPSESGVSFTFGPGTSRGCHVGVFSSAAAPTASSLLFAFGTSKGVLSLHKEGQELLWHADSDSAPRSKTPDIFALEFLNDNPSVLLYGGRPGILVIEDSRESPHNGTRHRNAIIHPSTIKHIKQVDSRHVLVAGLNSSLCQYDLRLLRGDDLSEARKSPLDAPHLRVARRNNKPTGTVLEYSGYQNTATIQIGFDVDLDSGIIAAAQEPDDDHPPVQLFSLHGGNKLHGLSASSSGYETLGARVKCLRFARDIDGSSKSLYVGDYASNDIQRFAWAVADDEDVAERKYMKRERNRRLDFDDEA